MPVVVVFHEGDALTLDGMRNNHGGFAVVQGNTFYRIQDLLMVVSINLMDIPAKTLELVC